MPSLSQARLRRQFVCELRRSGLGIPGARQATANSRSRTGISLRERVLHRYACDYVFPTSVTCSISVTFSVTFCLALLRAGAAAVVHTNLPVNILALEESKFTCTQALHAPCSQVHGAGHPALFSECRHSPALSQIPLAARGIRMYAARSWHDSSSTATIRTLVRVEGLATCATLS